MNEVYCYFVHVICYKREWQATIAGREASQHTRTPPPLFMCDVEVRACVGVCVRVCIGCFA